MTVANLAQTEQSQKKYFEWLAVTGLAYFFLVFYFGIFTFTAAVLLYKYKLSKRVFALLISFSLLWILFLLSTQDLSYWLDPRYLWWYTIPLFPVVTVATHGIVMFSRFLKPKSLQEQLAEQERVEEARQDRLSAAAARRRETEVGKALLRLGSKVRGQSFPDHLGIHHSDGWIVLDESVLDQHLFVLGTTGAGKSETIKRLVYEILTATDRNIYLVDGKGDEDLANDIRSLAYHHGRGTSPVFKLGFEKFGAAYDGFRGHATDVYNRLCALIGTAEAEGDAQYYADINRTILQFICKAPEGPPRSFEEVLERVDKEWLEAAYAQDPRRLPRISRISDKHFESLAFRLIPLAEDFEVCVGPEGFALEDCKTAVFSMRVQSVGDTAQRFLDFLVEDLKDFIGKRQQHPAVLIIDEFGQFSNKNITALLSLARSSQLAIILATQDVASLRDEQTKKLVLANTRTKLLMATDFPQEVAELAGTMLRFEHSIQHFEGDTTGLGSSRVQHQFAVDPNEVAKLRPGEAFIIRQRHHAKIKVRAIENVIRIEEQKEEKRERKKATTTPPKAEKKRKVKKRAIRLED